MWDIKIFGFELYFYFYNFIIFSLIGWIYECIYVGFHEKRFVNRGFLTGPMIPIYGFGVTFLYILSKPVHNNIVLLFIWSMLIATTLEYITSYIMEMLFHTKWWDYSHMKFHLNGRICLYASLLWGFGGVFLIKYMQPRVDGLINSFPREIGEVMAVVIFIISLMDFIITIIGTVSMEKQLEKMHRLRVEINRLLGNTRLSEMKNIKFPLEIKPSLNKLTQTRLFRAFPSMKSVNLQKELHELKAYLLKRKNTKKDK